MNEILIEILLFSPPLSLPTSNPFSLNHRSFILSFTFFIFHFFFLSVYLDLYLNKIQISSSAGEDSAGGGGGGGGGGPIRIRNLEDLIRQLEHSSRHMSPSGSEDIRESEAERHFRLVGITFMVHWVNFENGRFEKSLEY